MRLLVDKDEDAGYEEQNGQADGVGDPDEGSCYERHGDKALREAVDEAEAGLERMLSRSKEAKQAGISCNLQAMESGKLGWEALVVTQWLVVSRSNLCVNEPITTHF